MIKPAYSVSFLLSINIFVWQNVLYFLDAPRTSDPEACKTMKHNSYLNLFKIMCTHTHTIFGQQTGEIQITLLVIAITNWS